MENCVVSVFCRVYLLVKTIGVRLRRFSWPGWCGQVQGASRVCVRATDRLVEAQAPANLFCFVSYRILITSVEKSRYTLKGYDCELIYYSPLHDFMFSSLFYCVRPDLCTYGTHVLHSFDV